jgi:hypothetical protein
LLFIKLYDGFNIYKLPNESDYEFKKRLPEFGLYEEYLSKEYNLVKKLLMDNMKEKSIIEIDKLLNQHYPKTQINDSTRHI